MLLDTANGDYRLRVGSPCIDVGIQDTMIVYNNGQDTLFIPPLDYLGSAPDMGAYEFDPSTGLIEKANIQLKYSLKQNYPNPFNPLTKIKYSLPKAEKVKIEVFNTLGQKIETLLNKRIPAGNYEIEFNAQNLPSGVYMYRIKAGEFHDVKKMMLLR